MRRSAAPSQLNASKRPKFSVPYRSPPCLLKHAEDSVTTSQPVTHSITPQTQDYAQGIQNSGMSPRGETQDSAQSIPKSGMSPRGETHDSAQGIPKSGMSSRGETQDSAQSIPTYRSGPPTDKLVSPQVEKPGVTGFRSPLGRIANRENVTGSRLISRPPAAPSKTVLPVPPADTTTKNYFSVVWCKLSKKKHKKWEGDAVLVTHGRSVTLYDTEGKEIGRSSGFKSAELSSLKEDETLCIGSKEIQVMSVLAEEQFTSGKCFTSSRSLTPTVETTSIPMKHAVHKPFLDPNKDSSNVAFAKARSDILIKPRFDPSAPNAFVMKRPDSRHQWEHNKQKLPVVDVVVDPYLCHDLRPHQKEGVAFLYECVVGMRDYAGQGAILADDMGLGKTLQCITALWTLLKQGPYGGKPVIKRALIITPGSLVKNWFLECKKWLGTERLKVFAVTADSRVEEYTKTAIYPVLVISYEMFLRTYETIKKVNFDIVICDEGHRLKNTAIKTTSLIMSLPTKRRIIVTGTPIQNDLKEFYSIVEFCNPGILGTSAAFHRVYEDPILASRQPGASQEQITLGEERGGELTRLTKLFILRRTQEINNKYLPPKVELVLFCRPSPLQLSLYRQFLQSRLLRRCLSGTADGGGGGAPHLVCIAALKQLCNHPNLVLQKATDAQDSTVEGEESIYSGLLSHFPEDASLDRTVTEHSGKLVVLSAILRSIHNDNPKEKLVLVSNHTKTLNVLQTFCDAEGYKWVRLDGSTPTSQRQDIVNKFNSKHSQETVFLLSSKAGGVGLNLIGASRLVLYDIDWNPANDLQAMARVWRDGQTKKVHIYRLLTTGSIEEKVYQRQISKQSLSGAVVDLRDNQTDVQFSLEDLKDLFRLNEQTLCDTHTLLDCDCGGSGTTSAEVSDDIRSCQLGTSSSKSKPKRNLSMDELLHWHHTTGGSDLDPATTIVTSTLSIVAGAQLQLL